MHYWKKEIHNLNYAMQFQQVVVHFGQYGFPFQHHYQPNKHTCLPNRQGKRQLKFENKLQPKEKTNEGRTN